MRVTLCVAVCVWFIIMQIRPSRWVYLSASAGGKDGLSVLIARRQPPFSLRSLLVTFHSEFRYLCARCVFICRYLRKHTHTQWHRRTHTHTQIHRYLPHTHTHTRIYAATSTSCQMSRFMPTPLHINNLCSAYPLFPSLPPFPTPLNHLYVPECLLT